MKKSNEPKNNLVQRLITATLKLTKDNNTDNRSKSPRHKLKYGLPKSFVKAVDNARLTAGYDALPRHPHQAVSPTTRSRTSSSSSLLSSISLHHSHEHHPAASRIYHSSSTNDIDKVSIKKVPFRRTPRAPVQQKSQLRPQQQIPTRAFLPPRPPFRMMMNPNFMMVNRCPRPLNMMPMRPPMPIQSSQLMFRLRFR